MMRESGDDIDRGLNEIKLEVSWLMVRKTGKY